MHRFQGFLIALAAGLLAPVAAAQTVPNLLDFQGYLRTESGAPVNKTVGLRISLYESAVGGTPLYFEDLPVVPVFGGRFSIQVGATKLIPLDLFQTHAALFLGLSVDGTPELPLQQVLTVPYAFRSASSETAARAEVSKDLDCQGCVTAAKLGEPCQEGQVMARIGGAWSCATLPSWSGKDFALSSQACGAGTLVQGIGPDGIVACADDQWVTYAAGAGLVLEQATFSLDVGFTDDRYVNEGEAGAVTGPMLAEGSVSASKLGEPCKAGEILKMGPGGWACAADLDTQVVAGTGLTLSGSTLSADAGVIRGWAKDACYDTPQELAAALPGWDADGADDLTTGTGFGGDVTGKYDGLTIGPGRVTDGKIASVSWSKLTGVPPGFADGTDDGTTYLAGPGISIAGTTISIPDGGVSNAMLKQAQVTVSAGPGLSGGGTVPLGGTTTLSLANTTVTPGTYRRATLTVDGQGRLTAASNGTVLDLATEVSGVLPVANGGTGAGSAMAARANLGAAVNGVNDDITGLTRLNTQAALTLLPYGTTPDDESELRFYELAANGGQFVGLKAPDSIPMSWIWTLPPMDGTPGQVLKTDGNGDLGWATVGTGSVTRVDTGAGLTGGPITTTGTISIPNGGVTNAMLDRSSVTIGAGSGLTGGATVSLGGGITLSIPPGGVTNAMLDDSSVTVTAGTGLTGGGTVALGSAITVSLAVPVPASSGGTGLTSTGGAGNYLRSTGTSWTSSAIQAGDLPPGSSHYIQNQTGAAQDAGFRIAGNGLVGGRMGIGTAAPAARLDVDGDGNFTGPVRIKGIDSGLMAGHYRLSRNQYGDISGGVRTGWSYNTGVSWSVYRYIYTGTEWAMRDTEEKEILTAMGLSGARHFQPSPIVVAKLTWTGPLGWVSFPNQIRLTGVVTAASYCKSYSGAVLSGYWADGMTTSWKLCGSHSGPHRGGTYMHAHPGTTGAGSALVIWPAVVSGYFPLDPADPYWGYWDPPVTD